MSATDNYLSFLLNAFAQAATILGVIGLWLAYRSLKGSLHTFHHEVITSCTNRFQHLSPKLRKHKPKDKTIHQYVELCNEELFYFENGYLPQAVVDEWVEGMLSYLGLWCGPELLFLSGQPDNQPSFGTDAWHLATRMRHVSASFPRLCQAFTIDASAQNRIKQAHAQVAKPPLLEKGNEEKAQIMRAQMVLEVLANLRTYEQQPFYSYLHRKRIEAGSLTRLYKAVAKKY